LDATPLILAATVDGDPDQSRMGAARASQAADAPGMAWPRPAAWWEEGLDHERLRNGSPRVRVCVRGALL